VVSNGFSIIISSKIIDQMRMTGVLSHPFYSIDFTIASQERHRRVTVVFFEFIGFVVFVEFVELGQLQGLVGTSQVIAVAGCGLRVAGRGLRGKGVEHPQAWRAYPPGV